MHLCECVYTKYIFSNTKSLFVNTEMGILVVHTFVLCRIVLCVKCTTNRTLHLVCCFGPGLAVWAFTLLVDKHAFEARSKIMKSRLTVSNVSISKCLFRKFENFTLFLNFIAFLDILVVAWILSAKILLNCKYLICTFPTLHVALERLFYQRHLTMWSWWWFTNQME